MTGQMGAGRMMPMKKWVTVSAVLACLGLTGCLLTAQQCMVAELVERVPDFDAEARYAAYLADHGNSARQLREAASEAASMRIYIHGYGDVKEYLPLTEDEVQAVKTLLAGVENTPPYGFELWLEMEYDLHLGPQPAPPPYWDCLEFVSAQGEVLHSFYGYDGRMGDTSWSEEYRLNMYSPSYMLPGDGAVRWKSLPFMKRASDRMAELYQSLRESRSGS